MWNPNLFMTREQIRAYDRIAIETFGIPGPLLMENAGRGAAEQLMRRFPEAERIAVVTGPGNNGGDGFVIARHLINHGYQVITYVAHQRAKISGDAFLNLGILEKMGGVIKDIDTPEAVQALPPGFGEADVVVDALLGTGVSREVTGRLGDIIDRLNRADVPVVAVDIPSGLDADTGVPWGRAVEADVTVTFGHLKRGLLLHPGADFAGVIDVVSIGVPGQASESAGIDGEVVSVPLFLSALPKRPPDAHKGTFGHLLVVGGASGKTGAAAMAGRAAMRVGTGLCTLAVPPSAQPIIESKCLEAMVAALPEGEDALRRIAALLEGKKAAALGPGLSTAPALSDLALKLLESLEVPMVVDADGLNILAAHPGVMDRITAPTVLTPHPGEMARLVRKSIREVQEDRIGISRKTAVEKKTVLVLKGAHTVVAAPDGRVFINPTGNPGMASGGMGDVLTGIIGGLLAQEVPPLEAALAGVFLHGKAGDNAAEQTGASGLLASDVIDNIPQVMKAWGADR